MFKFELSQFQLELERPPVGRRRASAWAQAAGPPAGSWPSAARARAADPGPGSPPGFPAIWSLGHGPSQSESQAQLPGPSKFPKSQVGLGEVPEI